MKACDSTITQETWGASQGKTVYLFRMTNRTDAFVEITNFGATLVTTSVLDKQGNFGNVILGFPELDGYERDVCCIGSTIGRFANRIGGADFLLDGVNYKLDANDGRNTNHGGKSGFHTRVFDARIHEGQLTFTLVSKDGDGGFPGTLTLRVIYSWNDANELTIRFLAVTDKTTVANFTNHAYFNLSGGRTNIVNHHLEIQSRQRLEISEDYIPTGNILPTGDLTFEGQEVSTAFGKATGAVTGLNTYFLFDQNRSSSVPVCTLSEAESGRMLTVFTSYPGVQSYTGDFLNSSTNGNYGRQQQPFDGMCLECQFPPDSPNHSNFPSTRLEPGQIFDEHIIYKFSLTEGV